MMKTSRSALPALLLLSISLAGCALTPTYQRPAMALPAQWEQADRQASTETLSGAWWQRFGSSELDALMSQAMAANHDLAAAVSRIEQARASATISGAALLPSATVSASASRNRADGNSSDSDKSLLTVSYEIDLWGGNRARSQAAEARIEASRHDRNAVALVLQSDVASNYFQILALQDRLDIARSNLTAARELLTLVQTRFDNGAVGALEVAQQRTSVLNIEAQIPTLEQSLKVTRNALAVLLGKPPQGFTVSATSLRSLTLPGLAASQPASLLERRPDIRKAEASLIAANADIGAARAALYPGLDLSASAGLSGLLSGGSSTVTSLAASLSQTLFAGGQLRAQVRLSEATRQELVENYAQSVLTGLQEVQDSLIKVDTNARAASLRGQAVSEATEAYRLARLRYEAGAEDLLTVLDSQRTRLDAEDSQIQSELARYTAVTSLFKALGGGWQDEASQG